MKHLFKTKLKLRLLEQTELPVLQLCYEVCNLFCEVDKEAFNTRIEQLKISYKKEIEDSKNDYKQIELL